MRHTPIHIPPAIRRMSDRTCTIFATRRLSLVMLPLHSLQPARLDLAYSALYGASSILCERE